MPTYKMDDQAIVKTENATAHWDEATRWNGHNHVSKATGSQWDHQTLYRSTKGRFYIEHTSQRDGTLASAEWLLSAQDAARWLLANDHDLPEDLEQFTAEITE